MGDGRTSMRRSGFGRRLGGLIPTVVVVAAMSACASYPTVSAPWDSSDAPPGSVTVDGLPSDPMASYDTPGGTEPGLSDGFIDASVVDAYVRANGVVQAAFVDPGAGTERLAEVLADPYLAVVSARVDELAALGVVTHHPSGAPPTGQVLYTSTQGDAATARVCMIDDAVQVEVASGEAIGGADSSTLSDIGLVRVDGVWRVANETVIDEWPDLSGCRLAGP